MKTTINIFAILKKTKLAIVLLFLFNISVAQTSYENLNIIDNNNVVSFFNSIYSYNFVEAKSQVDSYTANSLNVVEKDLINANYYWWLIISGENSVSNQSICLRNLNLANEELANSKKDELTDNEVFNYIYINAYKARLEIFNNNNLKALMYLYNSMNYIKIALENKLNNEKFKFISGLYNYFVAYTIEKYPIFYPYLILFPNGNKELGIAQLKECASSNNILIRTEAIYFLLKINLEFESNLKQANYYSKMLTDSYSNNLIYRYYRFKVILQQKQQASEALEQYDKLKLLSYSNNQLSFKQKNHLIEIAEFDMKQKKIKF